MELGTGRGEVAEAVAEWRYIPVEIGGGMPEQFQGVLFSNEFFDALPVESVVYRQGSLPRAAPWISRTAVTLGGRRPGLTEAEDYLRRYLPPPEEEPLL